MTLFKVDYNIKDLEKFKADKPTVIEYVVAGDFKEAMTLASKYENDNLSLREVKVEKENFTAAIPESYKGAA